MVGSRSPGRLSVLSMMLFGVTAFKCRQTDALDKSPPQTRTTKDCGVLRRNCVHSAQLTGNDEHRAVTSLVCFHKGPQQSIHS